jgi:hypothetical protein
MNTRTTAPESGSGGSETNVDIKNTTHRAAMQAAPAAAAAVSHERTAMRGLVLVFEPPQQIV